MLNFFLMDSFLIDGICCVKTIEIIGFFIFNVWDLFYKITVAEYKMKKIKTSYYN